MQRQGKHLHAHLARGFVASNWPQRTVYRSNTVMRVRRSRMQPIASRAVRKHGCGVVTAVVPRIGGVVRSLLLSPMGSRFVSLLSLKA
jgi:hypothetical protein